MKPIGSKKKPRSINRIEITALEGEYTADTAFYAFCLDLIKVQVEARAKWENKEVADDVISDVFVHVTETVEMAKQHCTNVDGRQLKLWILKAINKSFNKYRQIMKKEFFTAGQQSIDIGIEKLSVAEYDVNDDDWYEHCIKLLTADPDGQALLEVINVLAEINERRRITQSDIAEKLGISQSRVSKVISRLKGLMRDSIVE